MKRLLTILAFLLLAAPAMAGEPVIATEHSVVGASAVVFPGTSTITLEDPWTQLARMNPAVLGSGGGAAECQIGDTNIEATTQDISQTKVYMWRTQASCDASLSTGKLYSGGGTAATAKLCLYSSSSTSPQAEDARVGCTSAITQDGNVGWKSASMSGSITNSAYYWVVIATPASATWSSVKAGISTLYYLVDDGSFYANPPDTLNGLSFSSAGSWAPHSAYGSNN